MKEKWRVKPKRVGRSRKIQVRQFEPEEIWIEYELDIEEASLSTEAVREATKLAVAYLDEEEKKLREKTQLPKEKILEKPFYEYGLEITSEGKNLGNFRIKHSDDPQFANFLHLWLEKDQQEIYVGFLRKDTGEFKFKKKNEEIIKQFGIKKEKHFRITQLEKFFPAKR